jgi:hypothetical protein
MYLLQNSSYHPVAQYFVHGKGVGYKAMLGGLGERGVLEVV